MNIKLNFGVLQYFVTGYKAWPAAGVAIGAGVAGGVAAGAAVAAATATATAVAASLVNIGRREGAPRRKRIVYQVGMQNVAK